MRLSATGGISSTITMGDMMGKTKDTYRTKNRRMFISQMVRMCGLSLRRRLRDLGIGGGRRKRSLQERIRSPRLRFRCENREFTTPGGKWWGQESWL